MLIGTFMNRLHQYCKQSCNNAAFRFHISEYHQIAAKDAQLIKMQKRGEHTMWRFEQPFSETQADVDHFLAVLNEHCDFFDPDIPLWLARAPGRLDLMGGIADYSGSLVLELPLGIATWAAIQPTQDRSVTLLSTGIEEGSGEPLVSLPLDSLKVDDEFSDYSTVHALLTADAKRAWVAYVAGVLVILQRERNFSLDQGLRIFIHSDVPAGKGVSSSAALEVAT